jgi:hypothetical protein
MEDTKIISTVIKIGTVVLTTVLSFVVMPPVLASEQDSPLSWKNIVVFCAGLIWIISYRKITNVKLAKRCSVVLMVLFLMLIAGYEFVYQKYSVPCYEKLRVVITDAAMTPEGALKYKYWLKHSQEPMKALLESNQCSSLAIWDYSSVALPYYGMLVIYLSIVLVFISLVIILSELILLNQTVNSSLPNNEK